VFTQAPDRLFSANRIISGEINEDSVMRLMYGTYDATSKRSTWDISKEGFDNVWGGGGFQTKTAYSSVNLAKYFQQAGIDRYIVVTETTEPNNDCHVCGIIIGGAVFSKVNNGWRLDALNKDITGLGAWGRGPGGELVKIGSNKYGVLFRSGDAHQGFTSEAVTIIGDVGNSIKELVTITDTAGGNGGVGHPDVPEFEYNSVIEFVPGNDTNYFDLSVTKSGTKMSENNTVVPFKEVRTYALIDSQYKERTANPLPPPPDQTAQAINLQAIENAPSTNQVTWKTYSDPAGRFQMEYPAEWTVAQENEDRRFNTRFTAPQPYVNLAAQIVLGGAERSVLESWQELHQQFQTTHGDGYQRVLLNEYTWAGQPAARWEFLLRGQHHPQVRQVGIRAWHQGVHYALFCTVPNETFAAWQSVCEHAIQSFRYLGLASLERDQRIWHALIRVRWHMDRGEYSDAVSELEKVKSLDPLNKEVFDLLARVKRAREAEARVLR